MAQLEQQLVSDQLQMETAKEMESELKRAQGEIEWLASFPMLDPRPIVEIDTESRICFVNPAAKSLFPDLPQKGPNHPWLANWSSFPSDIRDGIGGIPSFQIQVGDRWYNQTFVSVPKTQRVRIYGVDITERKRAESQQELVASILRVLNRGSGDVKALIRDILRLIRESTGFDAVGLRIRQGDDCPYYEQSGFSDEFLREENFLCEKRGDGSIVRDADGRPVLECTCGLVFSGRTDPSMPFFTEGGSFWTNVSSELLAIPIEADPRTNPRNRCIHNGYQSVALIPVRSNQEVIGLLQLNDRSEGRLSLEFVRFFEGLGDQIGLALKRMQSEEALHRSEELLRLFIEHAPACIAMLDKQMRYLAVSRRWMDDHNITRQQILGRSLYDFFPDIPDRWKEIHRRCLSGAVERAEEDPLLRADGTMQWLLWETRPWH